MRVNAPAFAVIPKGGCQICQIHRGLVNSRPEQSIKLFEIAATEFECIAILTCDLAVAVRDHL
jgi:hypothetical protein